MKSQLFCGENEVYDSGSVIMFDETQPLRIHIAPSRTFSFDVIIFIEKESDERNIEIKADQKRREILIKCLGFDPGAGTTKPIELATVGGKKMVMHLWVEKISAKAWIRKIEYTIFYQKAGDGDE